MSQYNDPKQKSIIAKEKVPNMIVRSDFPYNSEPPKKQLSQNFITPNNLFYVRNHGEIPDIDPKTYKFTVTGLVNQPKEFTLKDIQSNKFTHVTVVSPLQCAGNRRTEMIKVAPLQGEISWGEQAISNAEWKGVPLREILEACGVKSGAKHVEFIGLDHCEKNGSTFGFGGSIPLDKAVCKEVILAYEMNGKPLPAIHGYPLRVVVPGYIAARSIKWLGTINVRKDTSDNYFQARAYKMFPPDVLDNNVNWENGLMLNELSVSSTILEPEEGAAVFCGNVTVKGWACAGGNRKIARVDVSSDGGSTWTVADLGEQTTFGWILWKAQLQIPKQGPIQLVSKAFDTSCNTQPEDARPLWNFKGYMNNSVHRVNALAVKKPNL